MTLAATIDAQSAARTLWDAVVIGAGPAGSLAARELARRGRRVLLVDRKAFPRTKVCGGCLNGAALAVLRSAGLGDLPQRCGAVPLAEFRVAAFGRRASVPLTSGAALSRTRLDAALVEAALVAGAEFLPEAQATVAEAGTAARRIEVRHAGHCHIASARVVLVADGLAGGALSGRAEFRRRVSRRSRLGAGGVAAVFPAEYNPGTIFMAVGKGGYVGLVCVEDGRLNVAAALDRQCVKSAGGLGPAVAAVLEQAGLPAVPRLEDADWHGTAALTQRVRPVAAERVFVLGDAAGYVEPFTGEGIAWALSAGVAVAPLAADEWTPASARVWTRTCRRLVARRQWLCRAVAAALRYPVCVRVALAVLARAPRLAAPWTSGSLSGNGDRHPSPSGHSEPEPQPTGASPHFRTDSDSGSSVEELA